MEVLQFFAYALAAWLAAVAAAWVWARATAPGFDVRGRHVLVTGGSAGLGLEFAALCVRGGAGTVTIVARNAAKLEAARVGLTALGSGAATAGTRVLAESADVTDFADVRRVVERSERAHGGAVDLLVCNAGLAEPGYVDEQDVEVYHRLMGVNYFGCVHAVKAALPSMIGRRSGTVLLVGSALSVLSFLGYTQYCASKYAVKGFADALRGDLIRHNIRVQLFLPSNMRTEGYEREERTKPRETKILEDGGALSTPEESAKRMAGAVASGSYITCEEATIYLAQVLLNGIAPRRNPPLEFALLPVAFLLQTGIRIYADYLARNAEPSPGAGSGAGAGAGSTSGADN